MKARIDYVKNPDKTEDGTLVSSYACTPESADHEFVLARNEYRSLTGKSNSKEVIAYQLRQSFKPGEVTPEEIDRINILEATRKAMREAAAQVPADVFLIDAVTKLGLNGQEIAVIKGDASSYSIAAASIVAKVTRDRQMIEMDRLYPEYGFARNKGYGTKEHIEALKRIGPCPIHRRSFIGHFI